MKKYLFLLLVLVSQLVYSQAPTISQISPTSATGNVIVTLVGTNFTGATSVVLRSDVDASVPFRVVNPTTILATVNLGSAKYVNGRNGAIFVVTNGSGSNTTGPTFDYTASASTCNTIVYGEWSDCSGGKQRRTYIVSPSTCTTKPPKDSTERDCTTPQVRHFKYNANDNTIEIISNVPGIIEVQNSANEVVETFSYDAGPNTIDASHLSAGDYVAVTYGKRINLSNKFQAVIESADFANVVVKGKYGTEPYKYSYNSTTNYVNSLNVVMTKASHVVRCKDATGKVSAVTINNTYTNCTLKTTSNSYGRQTGAVIDNIVFDSTNLTYSQDYMAELAAAANRTTTVSSRGSTRDNISPVVSITSPVSNAVVSGTVAVISTITDNVGIKTAKFYVDGAVTALVAAVSGSTYTFSWNTSGLAAGTHTIMIIAKDPSNNSGSKTVQVSFNAPPPIVDVTPPTVAWSGTWVTGISITSGTTYTLTATASDNVGVSSVTFIRDSTVTIGTDATSPYSVSWNTTGLSTGIHYLKVRAIDAAGNKDSSTIVVNAVLSPTGDVTPPTIAFSGNWVNGYTTYQEGNDTVTVNASDAGGIRKVVFTMQKTPTGQEVFTDSVAPYKFLPLYSLNYGTPWSEVPVGANKIKATAYDLAGNTTTTEITVNVEVKPSTVTARFGYPVKATMTTPYMDTIITTGDSVILTANLEGFPGTIRGVTFYGYNYETLGSDNSYPYTCVFKKTNPGAAGTAPNTDIKLEITYDSLPGISRTKVFWAILRNIAVYKPVSITPPSGTTFPSVFSLTTPPVGNQGGEGSCVAFAEAYSAFSTFWYHKNNMTSYSYSTNIFSPEWFYNLGLVLTGGSGASAGVCSAGMSFFTGLSILKDTGVCKWATWPYVSGTCDWNPTSTQRADAANYKITSSSQILSSDSISIKDALYNRKSPVVIALTFLGTTFTNAGPSTIWVTQGTNSNLGTHAVAIVGYDDSKHAYKVMNSWGTGWGASGYTWIDYDLLPQVTYLYSWYYN